ncbi:hypothetical protein GCM10007079_29440 [Nocardiopsis terrae]|nr:hypothetical protein GCM10007079_29440 [Nocardiopsis terrae]
MIEIALLMFFTHVEMGRVSRESVRQAVISPTHVGVDGVGMLTSSESALVVSITSAQEPAEIQQSCDEQTADEPADASHRVLVERNLHVPPI